MKATLKKAAGISIVLLLGLAAIIGFTQITKPKAAEAEMAVLEKRNLSKSISVTGSIDSDAIYEAVLSSSQKVVKLYKKAGDSVQAGDTLVVLATEDLEYQLNKARLSLETLNISRENAEAQAAIKLSTAKDSYALAETSYQNIKMLYDKGAAAKDDFDTAANALSLAENQVKSAELQYNNLLLHSSSSDVQKQLERLNLEIENLNRKIAESTVKTTVSGTLTLLEARENQYPSRSSQGRVQVMDLSRLLVKADVSQYDAVLLSPGQKVSIKVKGLGKQLTGKVRSISDTATTSSSGSNTEPKYEVQISMTDPANDIRAGYDVDADIFVEEKSDSPAASRRAVQKEDGQTFVFVVEGGKAVKKYIKTGLETDRYVEILDGLSVGEPYIAAPPDDLKEGDRVNSPIPIHP